MFCFVFLSPVPNRIKITTANIGIALCARGVLSILYSLTHLNPPSETHY